MVEVQGTSDEHLGEPSYVVSLRLLRIVLTDIAFLVITVRLKP